ncbi:hypothetical protein [Cytobacillus gottheilii]|uniref:hypothetical protein n=1 Tax=Cytobacillus gottheilii TaxID=859144 RepID=UPI0009BB47A9|nr:hypothetical protein [Cytobacillus gottheilii]
MKNIYELEKRIKDIEKEIKKIERHDRITYELEQKLNKSIQLLIRIVEIDEKVDKNDLDYVLLKLNVDALKYHEVPILISRIQSIYSETGEHPTFIEFHHHVTDTLALTEEDKQDFSIVVTENLLKKFMGIEDNLFPVCEKILLTK